MNCRTKLKTRKKKTRKILILISILQIALLINFIIVSSYSYSVFLSSFLSINQIEVVSAQSEGDEIVYHCCTDTCQNFNSEETPPAGCDENPNQCEDTLICKTGTCYDGETGTCSVSTNGECEESEGEWYDVGIDEVDECKKGCCTWGNEKRYLTETQCEVLSEDDDNWDESVTEIECRFLRQVEGACVIETGVEAERTCRFVTEEVCISEHGGDFHEGFLCSSPELIEEGEEPICQKQEHIDCIEGRDEIYWIDSCGNTENIYSSDKDASWNNGLILNKSSSCTLDLESSSSVSSCGNCDSLANSICSSSTSPKVADGNFVCKDLRCHEGNDVFDSGESWCVYESYVGNTSNFGADIPGTLHWKKSCVNGEIKTDNCDNSRTEICAEYTMSEEGDEKQIAQCRYNNGWKCGLISIPFPDYDEAGSIKNQAEIDEGRTQCDNTLDCWAKKINVSKYFVFDVCVPKYAPGLNPDSESARDRCNVASLTCTAIEVKHLGRDNWVCEENCECLNQGFTEQMNDLCISLGDCGGYINIKGDYTKNFRVEGYDSDNYNGDVSDGKKAEYSGILSLLNALSNKPVYVYDTTAQGTYGDDALGVLEGSGEDLGVLLRGIRIGIGVGGGIAGTIGITVLTAVIAAVIKAGGIAAVSGGPVGLIIGGLLVIIGVVAAIWTAVTGIGSTREITIDFKCQPWQPPFGGENCGTCDDNPLIPCTEYKCKSLGAACGILEVYDSPNPVCVNAYSGDNVPPAIKFGEIEEDYAHTERADGNGVEIKNADSSCITEFTSLNFSLTTENEAEEEEYARCTYEWQHEEPSPADDYANVLDGESFEEGNAYSITHNAEITLPSVTNDRVYDISGNDITGRTGKLNMYVRCRDHAGNFNFNEYIINFCLKSGNDETPAEIKKYIPQSGSYLAYNDTDNPLEIKLSEPADCRWTSGTDKGYNDEGMTDFSACEDYNPEQIKSRWSCSTTLTGLTEPTNSIFIKCNDTNGNINEDGFPYTLYSTSNQLKISSIFPQGAIMRGGNLFDINLEVTTSGGAYNGQATCGYDFITPEWGGDVFAQTTAFHEYNFPALPSGDYNISIECNDEAGNTAHGNSVFSLQIDAEPPVITRAYKKVDENKLKIITNEQARCYYSLENCNFNLDDEGVQTMSSALSTEHDANWNLWEVYHIKCEDIWQKKNPGCAIVVTPAFI